MQQVLSWYQTSALASASFATYRQLSPWVPYLALMIVALHSFFYFATHQTGESDSLTARIVAIAAVVPFAFPKPPAFARRWLIPLLIPAITLTGPGFLFFAWLLELSQPEPDLLVVVRRQYELLAAVFLLLLTSSSGRVALHSLALVCLGIAGGYLTFSDIDLTVFESSWITITSIYILLYVAVVMKAKQRTARLQDQADTLRTVGASLAHELRTPLLIIKTRAQSMQRPDDAGSRRPMEDTVNAIIEEADTATTLIDMFLRNSASIPASSSHNTVFSIEGAIREAIARYPYRSDKERDTVSTHISTECDAYGERNLLVHIVFNLLKNSLNNAHPDRALKIQLETLATDDVCTIRSRDNGVGISQEAQRHIFDVFYSRTKHISTGVGLAFCREAVEKGFGGSISCESEPGEFTEMVVGIPLGRH